MFKNTFPKQMTLVILAVMLLSCGGCAPASAVPQDGVEREPTEEPGQYILIRYNTIQMDNSFVEQPISASFLEDGFDRARNSPVLADEPFTLKHNDILLASGCPGTSGFAPPTDTNLFMMASHTSLWSFDSERKLAPVPKDLLEDNGIGLAPFQIGAFTQPESQTAYGVPIGTMPLMLIYNPDILGELPPFVSLDDIIDRAREGHQLWLPNHMGIGGATFQALGGDNFTEETSFNSDVVRNFIEYAYKFDVLTQEKLIRLAIEDELLEGFKSYDLAWTIHDSSFLLTLAMTGYEGGLDVRPFPSIEAGSIPGSSAMSWAWSVPADQPYPEISWQLVRFLATDSGQTRWLLSQGMLPATAAGFNHLWEDPSIAKGYLPQAILENPDVLGQLQFIVGMSRPWRVPPKLPENIYQEYIVPTTLELIAGFVDGQQDFESTISKYLENLEQLK